MLEKSKIKYVHSLALRKFRREEGVFVAEGHKLVGDMLGHFTLRMLFATRGWADAHPSCGAVEVTGDELQRLSLLKQPQDVLAVFAQPQWTCSMQHPCEELCLALDGVQDPGNMGTILRVADWYGIRHVYCSNDTADVFNPKTVQATMGALARVQVHYGHLPALLAMLPGEVPVYGTFLDGHDMYGETLAQHGVLVMGNEGNGISAAVERHVTQRIYIPNYPPGQPCAESLNVAMATGIVCAEFRRRVRTVHETPYAP